MPYIFEKKYPKLYSELHPILNKGLDLVKLKYTSNKLIWWKCSKQRCGHDWKDTLASRIKDNECPKCKLRKKNWLTSEEVKIINNFKKIKDFENKIDKMLDFVFDENSTSNLRLLKIGNINKLLSKIKAVNKDTKKVFICYRESRLKENKEIKISKKEKELEKENKIKEKKAKKLVKIKQEDNKRRPIRYKKQKEREQIRRDEIMKEMKLRKKIIKNNINEQKNNN